MSDISLLTEQHEAILAVLISMKDLQHREPDDSLDKVTTHLNDALSKCWNAKSRYERFVSERRSAMTISDTLHDAQKQFGELLRQICLVGGYTQGKLSREALAEKQHLIDARQIRPKDWTGSFESTVLSKIMRGEQAPTYLQVYLWIRVLKRHFASAEFAAICAGLGIPRPTFEPAWEAYLWQLSPYTPPDVLEQTCQETRELKIIEIYTEEGVR